MGLFDSQPKEQTPLIDTPQIREAYARCQQGGADGQLAQSQLTALVLAEVIRKMTVVVHVPDSSLYDDDVEFEKAARKRAAAEARAAAKGETLGVLTAQRLSNKDLEVKKRHNDRIRFQRAQAALIKKICSNEWRGGGPCSVNGETLYCYQGSLSPEGMDDLAKLADMQLMDADAMNDEVADYLAPIPDDKGHVGMLVGNSIDDQRRAIREGYALLQGAGVNVDQLDPELRYNVKALQNLNDDAVKGDEEKAQQVAADKAKAQKGWRFNGVCIIIIGTLWAFFNLLMLIVGEGSAVSVLLNVALLALGILLVRKKKEKVAAVPAAQTAGVPMPAAPVPMPAAQTTPVPMPAAPSIPVQQSPAAPTAYPMPAPPAAPSVPSSPQWPNNNVL
ncbi:hypothetical protein [Bifidobacterium criceti]|uniref:Uncharacterized protein n=1 Tax=Bifidobacterium criceti TaxID=1960969 RepID=A0A2A2EHC3_9BIFI|nr:hypothetical protein [Bifidobacterium criceti]PAU68401.1 hypothetical protein B1526_0586 [Bifidobacterium criceti]